MAARSSRQASDSPGAQASPTRLEIDPIVAKRLRALAPQDLDLRFQPILQIRDPGRCALERFRPPELAALGTGAVVRCAKDLDLVHRLDELVLRRLGDVRQAWLDLGPLRERIPYISVNISAGSVANIQRQDALIALVRELRLDAALFRFELPEQRPWRSCRAMRRRTRSPSG
jgi:EAL domain-containing protein (putative c-di-GMP-specific phosphodiesterase class I)